MANYRVLKRSAEDYAAKYAKWHDVMSKYNDQIEGYNAKGAEFNSFIDRIKAGTVRGVAQTPDGQWGRVEGVDGQMQFIVDAEGNVRDKGAIYDSVDAGIAAAPAEGRFWARTEDGRIQRYRQATNPSAVPDEYGNSAAAPPPQSFDEYGNPVGVAPINPSEVDENGIPINKSAPQPQEVVWKAVPGTYRVAEFKEVAPAEPTDKMPTLGLTESQLRELSNPTLNAADAGRVQAAGRPANTGEMNQASGLSASVAGELHDNVEDVGILQRVLGGKI